MDFSSPPPPPDLGNYKGVMLCNRPPDDLTRGPGYAGEGQPPFRSTISATVGEQVGLPPCKKPEAEHHPVKTRGPSAALRRHVQWIRELQEQVQEDRARVEESAQAEDDRRKNMAEVFKKSREAIRQLKKDRNGADIERHELEAIMLPKKAGGARAKPLWAMTAAEKEEFDEEEASDLIRFAENLDYNKYIDDMEFRQCVKVVQDRARKLQREQDSFKESVLREFNETAEDAEDTDEERDFVTTALGGTANTSGSRRRQGGNTHIDSRPEWDASTACSDERPASIAASSVADRALESNPHLRAIHSKGSMQRLVEKATANMAD